MKYSLAVLLLLFAFSFDSGTWADDSNTEGVGGAVHMLTGHTTVRMVAEEVHITRLGTKLPKVIARFVFRNEGPATTVTMGFREAGGGADHEEPDRYSYLTNFQSTVDDKPVKVRRVVADTQRNGFPAYDEYTIWWTKRVHFRHGQTRIVHDSYEGGGGGDSSGNQWFTYILKSGASWKGNIGHARIVCDMSEFRHFWPVHIELKGYRRRGGLIVWDFYHLKPTQDVRLHWIPGFANVVVNGKPIVPNSMQDYPGVHFTSEVNSGSAGLSRLSGDDVQVELSIAADWLDAEGPRQIRGHVGISRGQRWVTVTLGSRRVQTSSGKVLYLTNPAALAEPGYTVVNLRPIVQGLGGKMRFDKKQDRVYVTLPPNQESNR